LLDTVDNAAHVRTCARRSPDSAARHAAAHWRSPQTLAPPRVPVVGRRMPRACVAVALSSHHGLGPPQAPPPPRPAPATPSAPRASALCVNPMELATTCAAPAALPVAPPAGSILRAVVLRDGRVKASFADNTVVVLNAAGNAFTAFPPAPVAHHRPTDDDVDAAARPAAVRQLTEYATSRCAHGPVAGFKIQPLAVSGARAHGRVLGRT